MFPLSRYYKYFLCDLEAALPLLWPQISHHSRAGCCSLQVPLLPPALTYSASIVSRWSLSCKSCRCETRCWTPACANQGLKELTFLVKKREDTGETALSSSEVREMQGNSAVCLNELQVRERKWD